MKTEKIVVLGVIALTGFTSWWLGGADGKELALMGLSGLIGYMTKGSDGDTSPVVIPGPAAPMPQGSGDGENSSKTGNSE